MKPRLINLRPIRNSSKDDINLRPSTTPDIPRLIDLHHIKLHNKPLVSNNSVESEYQNLAKLSTNTVTANLNEKLTDTNKDTHRIRPNSLFFSRFVSSLERMNSKFATMNQQVNILDNLSSEANDEFSLTTQQDFELSLKSFRKQGYLELKRVSEYYGINIQIIGESATIPSGLKEKAVTSPLQQRNNHITNEIESSDLNRPIKIMKALHDTDVEVLTTQEDSCSHKDDINVRNVTKNINFSKSKSLISDFLLGTKKRKKINDMTITTTTANNNNNNIINNKKLAAVLVDSSESIVDVKTELIETPGSNGLLPPPPTTTIISHDSYSHCHGEDSESGVVTAAPTLSVFTCALPVSTTDTKIVSEAPLPVSTANTTTPSTTTSTPTTITSTPTTNTSTPTVEPEPNDRKRSYDRSSGGGCNSSKRTYESVSPPSLLPISSSSTVIASTTSPDASQPPPETSKRKKLGTKSSQFLLFRRAVGSIS